jgi:uncharacterized protein
MNARVAALAILTVPIASFAQTPDPCATAPASCATLIQTHATSDTRIPNTVVDVSVGVSATGKDLPDVQRRLATSSNSLLAYLKSQKVERLITTGVSFAPETRYDKSGPDKMVGYNGNATVSFRTTPEKAPDILGGVLGNGANRIDSTTFTPTEQEIADARRHLSEDATRTAITQADAIAKAAGMHVVSIRNINVDSNGVVRPMPMAFNKMAAAQSVSINTEAGDQQLSMQVNITAAATR